MTDKGLTRKILAVVAFFAGIAVICGVVLLGANPFYTGPASDHFDGTWFFVPEDIPHKSWWEVWKWRLTAERAVWPEWVDHGPTDRPPLRVDGSDLRVSFVNHTTFLLQTEGLNILTDPIWFERASPVSWAGPKRVHAPGIAWEDVPPIDVVTISHSHYDHLDIPTLRALVARDNPQIITPLGVDSIIRKHLPQARIAALDWDQHYRASDALVIHAEPVYHWSARSLWDRNKTLWAAFVYELPAGNVYFSGDTGFGSGAFFSETAQRFGPFRFAMLDIGAYEPRWFMKHSHINPEEAVRIHRILKANQSVGMHFGTFQLSDEAIDDPVKDLRAVLAAFGVDEDAFIAPRPGDAWLVE